MRIVGMLVLGSLCALFLSACSALNGDNQWFRDRGKDYHYVNVHTENKASVCQPNEEGEFYISPRQGDTPKVQEEDLLPPGFFD
jgi:uncharacterized lipoprotein